MDTVSRGLDFVFIYRNDILVASHSCHEHRANLRQLFQRFKKHSLVINIVKC